MADVVTRIADLSPEKRTLLESRLMKSRNFREQRTAIPRRLGDGTAPASCGQEQLWFLDKLDPEGAVYNVPKAMRIHGCLDVLALEQALNRIVERHEALRTMFVEHCGSPMQSVEPARPAGLVVEDLSELPGVELQRVLANRMNDEIGKPFDLSREVKLRRRVFKVGREEHVLLLVVHHIASDGWSMRVLLEELSCLYGSIVGGKPATLPELRIQYADYAVWQREWIRGEEFRRKLDYWKEQLQGELPVLDLPSDRPRGLVAAPEGGLETLVLPAALLADAKDLARKEGVTLYMALLAAFEVLMWRYSGQDDFVVASPTAGRTHVETEGLIGFFVNTLALRSDVGGGPTFRELLGRVRRTALDAFAHQDVPFEKLVEELHPERTLRQSPLAQVMFILQTNPPRGLELPGLTVSPLDVHAGTSKFDLTLEAFEKPTGLLCNLEYRKSLFDAATASRILGHFSVLLEGIVANPDAHIWELPLLTGAERQQILVEWNDTRREYSGPGCIHRLFEEQVERTPDGVALRCAGEGITYRELNERANRLAHFLAHQGANSGALVGLCVRRSIGAYVGALGILKAGGAYIPLDPAYPADRLAFMLEDSRPTLVVTEKVLQGRLPLRDIPSVCIDADWQTIERESSTNPDRAVTAESVAYVVYTSGSTGKPKGVMGLHKGTVNRIRWMWETYPFGPDDVCCQKTTLSFVDSVWELFGPLAAGVPSLVIPDEDVRDTRRLAEVLAEHRVTRIVLVPSLLRSFLSTFDDLDSRLPMLKLCVSSGETLPGELAWRFSRSLPGRTLLNLYGSSEVSADVTYFEVDKDCLAVERVPIGRPMANTRTYILDRHGSVVPVGVAGELFVGGDGLAKGYLYRPELTAEKFVADPFDGSEGSRLYRTGDLVRFRSDGNIEFLGRLDHQVKIRGCRVELGEVEVALRQCPEVKEAVVLTRKDTSGGDTLVAYIVRDRENGNDTSPEFAAIVRHKLPEYMVPSAFVELDRFPLTPSGKVDRIALVATDATSRDAGQPKAAEVAPLDEVELRMLQLWERVLDVRPVGVEDDFFRLGGHSLLAVQLLTEVERTFGQRLPLSLLFDGATPRSLAKLVRGGNVGLERDPLVPIQPDGSMPPLFVLHGLNGEVQHYRSLARWLGSEQPIFGIQAAWHDGKQVLASNVREMAADYIEVLRRVQPHGPYRLAGYSIAGLTAYEMAVQLVANGEGVALLVLFDTFLPTCSKRLSFPRRILRHLSEVWIRPPRGKAVYLTCTAGNRLKRLWRRLDLHDSAEVSLDVRPRDFGAFAGYVPPPYPGKVTFFWADRTFLTHFERDPRLQWVELARGGVDIVHMPGEHVQTLEELYVEHTAKRLSGLLEKCGGQPGC